MRYIRSEFKLVNKADEILAKAKHIKKKYKHNSVLMN